MRVPFLVCLLTVLCLAGTATAQQAATDPVGMSTRPHYERIKGYVIRSADQMPPDQYEFRPTPDVRTFGQLIGHITSTQYMFCSDALGEKNPAPENFEKTQTTKAGLTEALRASFTYCDRAYRQTDTDLTTVRTFPKGRQDTPLSLLILNVGHNNEHYGNIVTYLRLKGMVPPSSQP